MVIEGRVYFEGELQQLCLGVEEGVIREIGKSLRGEERYDFGDNILLPGGIDAHVHFREPGLTHKEDFYTGSASAAVGGITTILDMPNTVPPSNTPTAVRGKRMRVSKKANVDFGLYAGVEKAEDMRKLEDRCHAFKVFMAESYSQPGLPPRELPPVLQSLETSKRRMTIHAEDPAGLRTMEETNLRDHWLARPPETEESAIRKLLPWGRQERVHVAHLSSSLGLDALRGASFTKEVTPMHLLLDWGAPIGPLGKINPPLRAPADREALWGAFSSGQIHTLASDHAPHTLEEKEEFSSAPSGAPNVETMYPMMFHLVRRGRLSLQVLVDAIASRPAKLFGMKGKGALRVGNDADVAVFDPRDVVKVRGDDLHYKCGWTPFEGWEAIFPKATILRGNIIARDRELELDRIGRSLPET